MNLFADVEEKKERQHKRDLAAARREEERKSPEPFPSTNCPTCSDSSEHGNRTSGDAENVTPGQEDGPTKQPSLSHENTHSWEDEASLSSSSSFAGDKYACNRRVAQGTQFVHVQKEQLPAAADLYRPLTDGEADLLNHLTSCYKEIFWSGAGAQRGPSVSFTNLPVETVMMAFDLLLRRFVAFSKRVPEFRRLAEADQIALLKAAAMRLYCGRLAEAYSPDRRLWETSAGEVTEEEVAHLFKEPAILTAIVNFCRGVKFVVSTDITVFALLQTLAIFDAAAPGLGNREEVNRLKEKYTLLVKHHLQAKLSYQHAGRYLTEAIAILQDEETLGQMLMDFFTDYSSHFHPLISEFLDQ